MDKKKIIYDIKEAIRAYNKDAKITNAYIIHLVNTVRSKYVRHHQKKNPGFSKVDYLQTLFLYTEVVDRTYFPDIPVNLTILRTKKALPQLVGEPLLSNMQLRPTERLAQEIITMEKRRAIYAGSDNFISSFLDTDGHIYFVNRNSNLHKSLKRVAVDAILFEPDAITDINDLDTQLEKYPLPASLWADVKLEVRNLILDSMKIAIDTVDDNQTIQ